MSAAAPSVLRRLVAALRGPANALASVLALAGGAVLLALVGLTCLSIAGRAGLFLGLPTAPIRGDTEWIEMGCGFAVFAFLPWCTLRRAHAAVDLAAPLLGRGGNRLAGVLADALMLAVAAVMGWQTRLGFLDKLASGESGWISRVPLWWGYGAALAGAAGFVLIAAFCLLERLVGANGAGLSGRAAEGPAGGAPPGTARAPRPGGATWGGGAVRDDSAILGGNATRDDMAARHRSVARSDRAAPDSTARRAARPLPASGLAPEDAGTPGHVRGASAATLVMTIPAIYGAGSSGAPRPARSAR